MNFAGKKLFSIEGLFWLVLGWSILVALVTACTILCLLDIPHWPVWRP
jgi:hypothetical protein